jgi:VWFA-related protein
MTTRLTLLAGLMGMATLMPVHDAAGSQQAQRPTFRSGTGRVVLSAVVRTRQGRPVTNLGSSDFTVVDSGVARPIVEFRAEPSAVRLALLVDFSGSMDVAAKRAAAQEGAWHLLSWLTAGHDEVSLYAFDRQLMELQAPVLAPGNVLEKLEGLKPFGQTSLFDAIAGTGRIVAEAGGGRRAVVALTDGADNASRLTPAEVSAIASAIDVPVYIVVVISPLERAGATTVNDDKYRSLTQGPLGNLARWTGGEIFTAIGSAQASLAARQIVTELRHQYLIAFEPDMRPGWHPIELQLRDDDLVVRTRSGYMIGNQNGYDE